MPTDYEKSQDANTMQEISSNLKQALTNLRDVPDRRTILPYQEEHLELTDKTKTVFNKYDGLINKEAQLNSLGDHISLQRKQLMRDQIEEGFKLTREGLHNLLQATRVFKEATANCNNTPSHNSGEACASSAAPTMWSNATQPSEQQSHNEHHPNNYSREYQP